MKPVATPGVQVEFAYALVLNLQGSLRFCGGVLTLPFRAALHTIEA